MKKTVVDYALMQSQGDRGFLVVAPDRDDMLDLFEIEDCVFIPIGQKGCAPSRKSGVFTNVHELWELFLQCSKSIYRNKPKDDPLHEFMYEFCGLLSNHSVSDRRTKETYVSPSVEHGVAINAFEAVADWLEVENLCDVDMYNHNWHIQNFPQEVPEGSSITPEELIGGEDIDDDAEPAESDFEPPTE